MSSHVAATVTAVLLLACESSALNAEVWEPVTDYRDRYVTRFQTRRQLVYEPRTVFVAMPLSRSGWNPFLKPRIEYKSIPVVRWIPRWKEESLPITVRQMATTTRVVQGNRHWISLPPGIRRDVSSPRRLSAPRIGGIAKLDDELPRVGAALSATIR